MNIKAVSDDVFTLEKRESQDSPATPVSPFSVKSIAALFSVKKNEIVKPTYRVVTVQSDVTKSSENSQDEKSKATGTKKNKNRSKKKVN